MTITRGFIPCTTADQVAANTSIGAWVTHTLTGVDIPYNATAVVIEARNGSGNSRQFGVRKTGSAENILRTSEARWRDQVFIELNQDVLGQVDLYGSTTDVTFHVVGYITDLTFLPEPVSLADQLALRPGETVSDVLGYSVIAWADAAKTATVPSDAEYAVIRVNSHPNTVAFHPTGERSLSPSSIVSGIYSRIVRLDADKRFGLFPGTYAAPTATSFQLVGWLPKGFYKHITAPNGWPASPGNWIPFPDSAFGLGYACLVPNPGSSSYGLAFSKTTDPITAMRARAVAWREPNADGSLNYYAASGVTTSYSLTGGLLSLTDVVIGGTDDDAPRHGASLTITVDGVNASGNTVTLGGLSQTVTGTSLAGGRGTITIQVNRGGNGYNKPLPLVVTNADGVASTPYYVSVMPPAGRSYIDVATPYADASKRIKASAEPTAGDQISYTDLGGNAVLLDDLRFIALDGVSSFAAEAWVSGDGWGETATQTLSAAADATPDPFTIGAVLDADLGSMQASAPVTPVGYDTAATVTVSDGEYSIDYGAFTSLPGYINPGSHIRLQREASPDYSTEVTATLTIGGTSAVFSITTRDENAADLVAAMSASASVAASLTTAASATSSVQIKLYSSPLNPIPIADTALKVWTRASEGAAAIDGGAAGIDATTDGAGVLVLSGLSIPAGAGVLTVTDPSDPRRSRNLHVTFS